MTANGPSGLSDEDLIALFRQQAHRLGSEVVDMEPAVQIARNLMAIENELRLRGRTVRLRLLPFLEDQDRFVRYYAAQHLLGIAPVEARKVIEENAKYWFDAIAGDARGTLREFDTGKYKPV